MPPIGLTIDCAIDNFMEEFQNLHPFNNVSFLTHQQSSVMQIEALIITECDKRNEFKMLIYYVVFAIVSNFGMATIQNSHLAMIPEIAYDDQDRMTLTSVRNAATVISNLSTYAIFLLFVKKGNIIFNLLNEF